MIHLFCLIFLAYHEDAFITLHELSGATPCKSVVHICSNKTCAMLLTFNFYCPLKCESMTPYSSVSLLSPVDTTVDHLIMNFMEYKLKTAFVICCITTDYAFFLYNMRS